MTTAPACRLTWHRGSVLPYSSLWHTVQRAMWLNSLRPSELSFCACALDQGGFPRQVNLLFNETSGGSRGAIDALSMQSLAQALGEPETAFTWAHMGRVSRSRRLQSRAIFGCSAIAYLTSPARRRAWHRSVRQAAHGHRARHSVAARAPLPWRPACRRS